MPATKGWWVPREHLTAGDGVGRAQPPRLTPGGCSLGETPGLDRLVAGLAAEFSPVVDLETIQQVVLSAHRDLVGEVPVAALAEFTHRLAWARLDHSRPAAVPDPGQKVITHV